MAVVLLLELYSIESDMLLAWRNKLHVSDHELEVDASTAHTNSGTLGGYQPSGSSSGHCLGHDSH